jgi:FkbM family methyltransferase
MSHRPAVSLPSDGFNELAMCRSGPMIFNRHDQYIGASLRKYGEFSNGETTLFREILKPGMMVVDVGANIGVHTVEFSHLVGNEGSVFAFEPQRLVYQTLCGNLALNSCRNVHAYLIAIGETTGEIRVPALSPDRANNFGGLALSDQTIGEPVPMHRIDSFGLRACHLIKIDIEGMELAALRGATETIARCRPVLYVESDREDLSQPLLDLLAEWNYNVHVHMPPIFSPDNFAGDPEDIFPDLISRNLLCIPAENDAVV